MRLTISKDLEFSILRAVAEGWTDARSVVTKEFSKDGQMFYAAIEHLFAKGSTVPLKPSSIALVATEVLGAEREKMLKYARGIDFTVTGPEIDSILGTIREQKSLMELITAASEQLATGHPNTALLQDLMRKSSENGRLTSMATTWDMKLPTGFPLESLPMITKLTGGVMGLWIVGGEPGMGKSTFAWQIALEFGRAHPVLYYDLDATGLPHIVDRTRLIAQTPDMFNTLTERVYYRESIRTLEDDLRRTPPPALVVIDSVQTLPTQEKHRRTGLDNWIMTLKSVLHRGYTMLMISEKPRSQYGLANVSGFKESGELEYACSLGAMMSGSEVNPDAPIKFHIVKNRHRKARGHVCSLVRHPTKAWWFTEYDWQEVTGL